VPFSFPSSRISRCRAGLWHYLDTRTERCAARACTEGATIAGPAQGSREPGQSPHTKEAPRAAGYATLVVRGKGLRAGCLPGALGARGRAGDSARGRAPSQHLSGLRCQGPREGGGR